VETSTGKDIFRVKKSAPLRVRTDALHIILAVGAVAADPSFRLDRLASDFPRTLIVSPVGFCGWRRCLDSSEQVLVDRVLNNHVQVAASPMLLMNHVHRGFRLQTELKIKLLALRVPFFNFGINVVEREAKPWDKRKGKRRTQTENLGPLSLVIS
jgi:hypothetical protein